MNIILYGPPAAGKTSVGQMLARRLRRPFVDADLLITQRAGLSVPEIFDRHGEAVFRGLEAVVCAEIAGRDGQVIALGGGTLLNHASRASLELKGVIVCLTAAAPELLARMSGGNGRPLLGGADPRADLGRLLASRRAHYDSFPTRVDTTGKQIEEVTEAVIASINHARLDVRAPGLAHRVVVGHGLLEELPALLARENLHGPYVLVTDENVERCLFSSVPAFSPRVVLQPGESQKAFHSVEWLCRRFVEHGLDRAGTVVALGGGVVGDLAGFAAATFMRGVRWVNVPTTVVAMVDASIGGKTGVNLPEGKNLVGAFHAPALVVSDPLVLATLPDAERISGMAEVVKHAIIGNAALFQSLEASPTFGSVRQIEAALAVKIGVVEADPFERGIRATLNFGHTIGHALEAASLYAIRHGEAVAIGMVAEACLAERLGLAAAGLSVKIASVLERIGLPTLHTGRTASELRAAMAVDKKAAGGRLRFSLPIRIGEVRHGVEVDEALLAEVLGEAGGGR